MCAVLCVAADRIWFLGLCCAAHIPCPQEKFSWLIVKKNPVGSFNLVMAIMAPLCCCLYLNVRQYLLM